MIVQGSATASDQNRSYDTIQYELEEASTHKNAKTHAVMLL